jgi:hypothetical protein
MKKLFLFLLLQGSLDLIGQDTANHRIDLKAQGWIVNSTPDTVRASLLLTRGHMTIAFSYEGYAIRQGEKIIGCLDDKKRPFKVPVRVWGYLIKDGGK